MDGVSRRDIAKLGQELDDAAGPDFITKLSQLRIDSEELVRSPRANTEFLSRPSPVNSEAV